MGSKIGKCLIRQRQSVYTMLSKLCSKTAILSVFMVIMMITAITHMNERRNMLKLLEKSPPKIVKNEVHSILKQKGTDVDTDKEYPMVVENGPVDNLLEVAFNGKQRSQMKRKIGINHDALHRN
ncbi:hypothetical protein LSTR_LSTR010061 [Laodelphax striatellus]|uniref:Uncharacterized protein n=1 Tax=Laodelphax striatellus TaxID=195883 RepID=A0A482WN45_LAOST|nr:hypothetical protein LSTR_LSTR010061 [Laodelphax striatellus]